MTKGRKTTCVGVVHGKSGTTKITATALLKRVDGNVTTTVKARTGLSAKGDTFYFDKLYYVASGHTYELEIDAKIYQNCKSEYVSLSDSKYCGG